jgi:hypothetical protein
MKFTYVYTLISSFLVTAFFSASSSAFQNHTPYSAVTATAATHKVSDKSKNGTPLKLPNHFTAYVSESIGDGKLCVVGAATDDDGLNQKPIAYLADTKGKQAIWVAQLDLPPNTFQSRATHCNQHGGAVFVLLQSDTQSEQSLSQTLLRVVKLDAVTGAVKAQRNVDVAAAYTTWVDEGENHFQWQDDVLTISGNYRRQSDQDEPTPFTTHLTNDLNL